MTPKITHRINALRANAADPSLTAEARQAYAAKADKLQAKYGTAPRRPEPAFPFTASQPEPTPEPAPAPRARTSHASCNHEATKAARAACRRSRG